MTKNIEKKGFLFSFMYIDFNFFLNVVQTEFYKFCKENFLKTFSNSL